MIYKSYGPSPFLEFFEKKGTCKIMLRNPSLYYIIVVP